MGGHSTKTKATREDLKMRMYSFELWGEREIKVSCKVCTDSSRASRSEARLRATPRKNKKQTKKQMKQTFVEVPEETVVNRIFSLQEERRRGAPRGHSGRNWPFEKGARVPLLSSGTRAESDF